VEWEKIFVNYLSDKKKMSKTSIIKEQQGNKEWFIKGFPQNTILIPPPLIPGPSSKEFIVLGV
jgi:hypothetical protein